MQLATYGAYGICLLITLVLLIVIGYVKGGTFVSQLFFYLLIVVCFITRESFALTNDSGEKKGKFFYLMILLVSLLALMSVATILFSIYIIAGQALLGVLAT